MEIFVAKIKYFLQKSGPFSPEIFAVDTDICAKLRVTCAENDKIRAKYEEVSGYPVWVPVNDNRRLERNVG